MIREAVSILLTRDPDSTEAFLVERSPQLSFFGGYFAFPGGTLDQEDAEIAIKNADRFPEEQTKYLVAAAREVFEETGILLTHGEQSIAEGDLRRYRQRLLDDQIHFSEILKSHKHFIDACDFAPICRILTPEFSPVRYETQFYWAKIPEGREPEIWPGELISGRFLTAEEALAQWKQGEILVVPPLIIMLQELSGRNVRTFARHAADLVESYRKGKLHRVHFTPGIHMLPFRTRTLPPATHTNMYLVGESRLYLIDSAPSSSEEQERLWDYLEDLKAEGRTFEGILLTHHHSDHIGAVDACRQRFGLPVLAHRDTAGKLLGLKVDRFIEHGDELDLGEAPDGRPGWKLRAYHTPGHAEGHLVFQETRYGALLAGDMISTVSTIVISPPEGHLATYLRSLEFLKGITTGTLYPAHGPAVAQGQAVIQEYIDHRRERERKLLSALQQGPQTRAELLRQVYDDVDPQLWPLAERSLLAGLIKLIEEGRCVAEDDKYRAIQ